MIYEWLTVHEKVLKIREMSLLRIGIIKKITNKCW